MTKKQKEIQLVVLWYKGKEVKIWLNGQMKGKRVMSNNDAYLEGTVVGSTGTYLTLKNVLLYNGKYLAEYDVSIGTIGRITSKNK